MLRFRAKPTVSDAFRLQLQVLVAVLGNYMLLLKVLVAVLGNYMLQLQVLVEDIIVKDMNL